MSSTGQIIGTIAGAVIGFFVPVVGVALGAAIGGAIGSAIDPPKGPKIEGPRLKDLNQQTASYGLPIPRAYGTVALHGNVFWIENNLIKEVSNESEQGGKGSGGASVTEYSYFGTFAVGLCQGPIQAVKRIWLNNKLWYNGTSDDVNTLIAAQDREQFFTVYYGTDDQQPDARMQAALGIDSTPAYRGLCYIVFKDLPLEDFGNTIIGTQVKVEVIHGAEIDIKALYFNYDFSPWTSGKHPQILGVVDGLFEVQEKWTGGVTQRYAASGMALVDTIFRPEAFPTAIPLDQESAPWATVGTFFGRSYRVKHGAHKDYHGWGSGTICYGDLVRQGSLGMELVGTRIDEEIIATRVANSLSASWYPYIVGVDVRGFGFFVVDLDLRWYFIDPDGAMIAFGTVDQGAPPYYSDFGELGGAFGPTSNPEYTLATDTCCSFDSSIMRVVFYRIEKLRQWDVSGSVFSLTQEFSLAHYANNSVTGSSVFVDRNLTYVTLAAVHNTFAIIDLANVDETVQENVRQIVDSECATSRILDPSDIDTTALDKDIYGYVVGSIGAIRSAIEPLQAYYPMDVFNDGYKIKFVPRGGSSVATFSHYDMVINGGENSSVFRSARETDSQLPVKVSVKYLEAAREYDIGEQYAQRYDENLVNLHEIDLPVVMTEDQAAGIAEMLLYLYWMERYDLSFILPPSVNGMKIQPADVVTLQMADETHMARMVSIESMPDGTIQCTAKPAGQSIYTPTEVGESSLPPPSTIAITGPTMATLLDVPYMMDGMDKPGFVGAMYSPVSTWNGGVFFNSNDNGESWNSIRAVNTSARAGIALTALSAAKNYGLIDADNTLTVSMGSGALDSVSESQMLGGSNHFAIGADGRWEICAAQTVTDIGNNQYTLSKLMRGRYGTEGNGSLHQVGDTFVMLDSALLNFLTIPISSVGIQNLWKAVGYGKTLESVDAYQFTCNAKSLKPLAPIRLRGGRNPSTNDWVFQWERRSRMPVEPFSGVATPIGETAEAYEVEVWNSDYSLLKRTITGLSSKTATWTSAQQLTDFGSNQNSASLKVFQLSSVIGRGEYLQSSVTDNLFVENVLVGTSLLHFDGTNGATSITDSRGATWTRFGTSSIATAQSKFGVSSLYGPGQSGFSCTGSQVTVGASTPFTAEWFAYPTAYPDDAWVYFFAANTAIGVRGGKVTVYIAGYGTSTVSVPLNTWGHWAISRDASNVLRWFFNGALVSSTTWTGAVTRADIGGDPSMNRWVGYVDEFMFEPSCLYTSAFTPRTSPVT